MFNITNNHQLQSIIAFFRSLHQINHIAYKASPTLFFSSAVLRILQSVTPVVYAFILKIIFDNLGWFISGSRNIEFETALLPPLIILGIIILFSRLSSTVDNYLSQEMARRLYLYTSTLVYSQVNNLQGMHHFESSQFYDTLRQASTSVQSAPNDLVKEASYVIGTILTICSFLGVLILVNPILALLLVISTIPTFFAQLHFRNQRFKMNNMNSPKERKAWYFSTLLSHVLFAKEVRLFNLGNYFLNEFTSVTKEIHNQERHLNLDELKIYTGLGVFNSVITIIIYIYLVKYVFTESATLGDITFLLEATRNLQTYFLSLSATLVSLTNRTLFFTHYQNLLALPPLLEQYTPIKEVPPLKNCIELRNVSFYYVKEQYVLRNINLKINKGQKLALVGLNGAGKTTIVKLLARLYDPIEGEILWDGIDIRHFSPSNLRERLGAILQDFVQYELTVRDNIGLGNVKNIKDIDYIVDVAKRMNVDQFVRALPDQYDTILSRWLTGSDEKGTDLSGGQWQKIAIARAYARNADVLLLDEPTASLDAEAEFDIYRAFSEISEDRATLLISHRFSTVKVADKIAVIKDGIIVEYGTHEELIKNDSEYAYLYSLQASQYKEL